MVPPLRVLVVTNMYPGPHSATDGIFIQRQVEGLRARGLQIELCHVDTVRSKLRYLGGWWRVLRALRAGRYDLVHVHYGLSLLFYPPPLAWLWPTVVTLHGSDLTIGWQRRITRALLSARATAVTVSARLAQLLRRPARVIACGVDARRFAQADPAVARALLRVDDDARLILFGANPNRPVKCHELFAAAAALLAPRQPSYRFVTLADVPPAQVPSLMAAADVLVLTSWREGSPVVTKEALCAGTRVVSLDVGDVSEQLAPFSGTAVPPGRDPAGLAAAIEAVLAQPAPDRDQAAGRFDLAVEVAALEQLYREVSGRTK